MPTAPPSNTNQGKNITNQNRVNQPVTKSLSFAQVTKGAQQSQPKPQQPNLNNDDKINKILDLLTSFDDRLKKLESSAKLASSSKQRK